MLEKDKNGMIEKLIENWLINVHELGYTIPFCELLLSNGYTIIKISRQGRGELGKDVIARHPDGQLHTFQLKGPKDIDLPEWRRIQDEIRDLVQLPAIDPSINREEPHIPFLVTNGEIVGDALPSIEEYANDWERRGYPRLKTLQRHELLRMFIDSHGSYLPTDRVDVRQFVEFYVIDVNDRLPRKKFAGFLERLVTTEAVEGRGRNAKRAIESMVLMGAYILEQYERAENHVSAAEGWTIVAATILHVAQRERLPAAHYQPSLSLVWKAVDNNLQKLKREILERNHFVEPKHIIAETDFIRGVRTLITLGWLTATFLIRVLQNEEDTDGKELLDVIKKNLSSMRWSGEADWPSIVCLSLYLERMLGSSTAEGLLENWVQSIIEANKGKDAEGMPPPYWLQEKVLALRYDQLPPYKAERFDEHSYTIHSALDMLVRRLCRRFVSKSWPEASRLTFCDYIPDDHSQWFLWRSKVGDLQLVVPQQPASWSEWSKSVSVVRQDSVPSLLLKHPEWILPFALTYPHRMNRPLSAVIDCLIGERASMG